VIRVIFVCLVLLFVSCKDRKVKVYEVPDEVQPYVSSFLVEAARRGNRLVIDDLIVTYEYDMITSRVHAAGLCRKRYGHTPIIHIDTTSPNWKASDMSKEQLVFHELCHCILGRGHTEDTLLNGNPASIMKPTGETLYGPILTAFKREYYIDELFDPLTEKPAWAQLPESYNRGVNVIDTIFYENFLSLSYVINDAGDTTEIVDTVWKDKTTYKDWALGENVYTRRWVMDGRLELESYARGTFFIPFYVTLPEKDDFEITLEMVLPGGKGGIMSYYWGGSSPKDPYALVMSDDGYVSVGEVSLGVMTAKAGLPVRNDDYNTITIRRIGTYYYIYINGRFLDNLQFEPLHGDMMGVGVSGHPTEIWVRKILVTRIKA